MATEMCISERQNNTNSVMENIYGIIDSKIQYLDHQTKGIVRPLIKETSFEETVQGEASSDSFMHLEAVEKMFIQFEQQSKRKKLLLQLKMLLNSNNALLVLALLSDNTIYEFNEQEVLYILDSKYAAKAA